MMLLTVVVMVVRLPFFLSHPVTRLALLFNLGLLVAATLGLLMVFRQNLFERWRFFRRLEERTALGRILSRSYHAFRLCLNRPAVVAKTILLSLVNHLVLVLGAFFLGTALGIPLSFWQFLTVFPIVNAVAAVPLTPGGLGTREAAAVYLLGVPGLDVPKAEALSVSLLLYATLIAWSLVGGLVYAAYCWALGPDVRREIREATAAEGSGEPAPQDPDPSRP
jgi:uncharacterized protein (TIRG00374 family)